MAQAFVGEIRVFAGNFPPNGWMLCQGQLLAISQFTVLYDLIGTTYGGDGQQNFALPDLRGRVPISMGQAPGLSSRIMGSSAGEEAVTLTVDQLASHTHAAQCSTSGGNQSNPDGHLWARQLSGVTAAYQTAAPDTAMSSAAVSSAGTGGAHNNLQPYLTLNYIISLFGVFPSQG